MDEGGTPPPSPSPTRVKVSNRSPWSRRSAFLTLLLHLLVVALGPIADARLDAGADEVHASVHVEADDAPPCSSGHDHDECLICRTLQAFDAPLDGGARLIAPLALDLRSPLPPGFAPRSLPATSSLGPRAPPLV